MLRPLFFLTVLTVTATTSPAQWQLQDAHTTADYLDFRAIQAFDNNTAIIIATLRPSALQRPTN